VGQDQKFRMTDRRKQDFEEQHIWHKYTVILWAIFWAQKRWMMQENDAHKNDR